MGDVGTSFCCSGQWGNWGSLTERWPDSGHYRGREAPDMLMVSDCGCDRHLPRRLKYFGPEALVMREVITNLHTEGDCHTYICGHGYSHRLRVEVQTPESLSEAVLDLNSL